MRIALWCALILVCPNVRADQSQSSDFNDLINTGTASWLRGHYGDSEKSFTEALNLAEAEHNTDRQLIALRQLANVYRTRGMVLEAISTLTRVSALLHRKKSEAPLEYASAMSDLAGAHRAAGDARGALELYREANTLEVTTLSPTDPQTTKTVIKMAETYIDLQKFEEADSSYRFALGILEKAHGPASPLLLPVLDALGHLHMSNFAYDAAEPHLRRALTIREQMWGPANAELISTLDSLAYADFGLKRHEEAETLYYRLLKIWEANAGLEHPMVALTLDKIALLHTAETHFNEAECAAERASRIREKILADGYARAGEVFLAEKKPEFASPLYEKARKLDSDSETVRKGVAALERQLHPEPRPAPR